jgi:hypothetical protein
VTIKIGTALKNNLLASSPKSKEELVSTTMMFNDGTGPGGQDTIVDPSGGLGIFKVGAFISLLPPNALNDPNRNKIVKVLDSTATQLVVAAGSLTELAAGPQIILQEYDIYGSFSTIFRNCIFRLFKESVPDSADDAEPGTPICEITLNGNPFVAGQPANGLNFGDLVDSVLRRAIDPATGSTEVWSGLPTETATVKSFYCYSNDVITGGSIVSHRFCGSVTGKGFGGDMQIESTNSVSAETPVLVTSVNVELKAAALL